ncbi:MAG: BMP family ABC transporter substrate-binding protein [Lachnospiraceae bacterium]|nr:BMP family ABC transporter substrate-binding protein [Lachnospiraceae bacterium]
MKKVISVLLTGIMSAVLIAGCAGTPEGAAAGGAVAGDAAAGGAEGGGAGDAAEASADGGTAEGAESAEGGTVAAAPAGDALKIAIVSSGSGVDDGSFAQNNYNGIQAFIKENPNSTVTPVKEENGDVAAAVQAVADIVADYDAIVCCGFQFAGITSIAQENPNVKFILVDTYPTDEEGNEAEVDNIYAMSFKEQEGGFCAGLAAALETKSGKVAVVNGIAYPTNVNYQYGFESGVNYANKHLGAKAELVELASYAGTDVNGKNVGGNYANSFGDEATGKVIGEALIKEGVDMIFTAAGATGNGVLTAVKEAKDVYYIGCDVDQYDDGERSEGNVIMTSALKIMDKNVEKQLNEIKNGTFKGGNYLLGADTDSTGYVSADGRQQLKAETIKAMDEAFAKVKSGEIIPAANFNGEDPESFTGL